MAEGVPELSGLGVLTWVYPPDMVDRGVAACGRAKQRRRLAALRRVHPTDWSVRNRRTAAHPPAKLLVVHIDGLAHTDDLAGATGRCGIGVGWPGA